MPHLFAGAVRGELSVGDQASREWVRSREFDREGLRGARHLRRRRFTGANSRTQRSKRSFRPGLCGSGVIGIAVNARVDAPGAQLLQLRVNLLAGSAELLVMGVSQREHGIRNVSQFFGVLRLKTIPEALGV